MADERFRGLMALVAQRVQKNLGEAAKAAQFATDVQNKTTDQIIGLYVKRADPVTFRIIISPDGHLDLGRSDHRHPRCPVRAVAGPGLAPPQGRRRKEEEPA